MNPVLLKPGSETAQPGRACSASPSPRSSALSYREQKAALLEQVAWTASPTCGRASTS